MKLTIETMPADDCYRLKVEGDDTHYVGCGVSTLLQVAGFMQKETNRRIFLSLGNYKEQQKDLFEGPANK